MMWNLWKDARDGRRLRPSAGLEAQARLALSLFRWRLARRAGAAATLPAGLRGVAASVAGAAAAMGAIELACWLRLAVWSRIGLDPAGDSLLFAYGFALSLGAGAALGLWPALAASRRDLHAPGGEPGGPPRGIRGLPPAKVFAAAQAAAWVLLLAGSGLFIRGLHTASSPRRVETWNALPPQWELKLAGWDGEGLEATKAGNRPRTE
jgi:hypothetical protein